MNVAADPMLGRVLDRRYRIEGRIARGGMAVVYEATDLRLDRPVAVKVMHEGLASDDEFVARFEREARSAARLSHHNAVAVFDQGEDNGTLFLVMELVPGRTLRDLIRKEAPLPPAHALALIDPILCALNAAHQAGMIHRDVKPENVLLPQHDSSGNGLKVADFGLARAVNTETHHTATGGVLIGTVSYLAPELVVNGRANARVDVYAAGVLIYEMLTGQKPHQADSPIQVAYKHVHEDIPVPSAEVQGIPAYVDALVARATARDPSLRPADAGVLLHQVRRVRHALAQGVVEDEELTDDLMPHRRQGAPEPTGEITGPLEAHDVTEQEAGAALAVQQEQLVQHGQHQYDEDPTTRVPRGGVPPRRPDTAPALREPEESPRRRGPMLLAGLLVLVLLGVGGWYFFIERYQTMPGVADLSQQAARVKLAHAGLRMKVEKKAFSETVPRGEVITSDPSGGSRILKHGTASVVISRGPEMHPVPAVHGLPVGQARSAITHARLAVGDVKQVWSQTVPKGDAVGSSPATGTKLRRDTAVDLTVSKGKRPIKIPDLTGKAETRARKRLRHLGFKVQVSGHSFSNSVPKGAVLTQSPSSGTGHRGDTVTITISRGPRMVSIPSDLGGRAYADAAQELRSMGLHPHGERSPFYIGLNRVAQVDPGPGTPVPVGSSVTLALV